MVSKQYQVIYLQRTVLEPNIYGYLLGLVKYTPETETVNPMEEMAKKMKLMHPEMELPMMSWMSYSGPQDPMPISPQYFLPVSQTDYELLGYPTVGSIIDSTWEIHREDPSVKVVATASTEDIAALFDHDPNIGKSK